METDLLDQLGGITRGPVDTEKVLRALASDFSLAPLSNGRRMRDLLKADREAFSAAAISVLSEVLDERGTRYLVTLLWTNEILMDTLANQSIPKELSVRIAQTAAKVDTQLYIRLMRYLVEGMLETHRLGEAEASRLLEVLAAIAEGGGLQPFLRQMLLHPSPRIRSKITLLLGRGSAGFRALARLIEDEDPRVRANAVEALWHNTSEHALQILRDALRDTNNRVLGNAILGLHRIGDPSCIPAAIKLAQYPNALHRATAAWAIGRTGDPRFLPFLGRMLVEADGHARRSLFRSIENLKKAQNSRVAAQPLSVSIFECKLIGPNRAGVTVVVTDGEGATVPDIVGTQIITSIAGNPVLEYTAAEIRGEQFLLAWVLPRRPDASDWLRIQIEVALKTCLVHKRRPEQWCIARYRTPNASAKPSPVFTFLGHNVNDIRSNSDRNSTPVLFTANKNALTETIESPGLRFDTGEGPFASIHTVISGQVPSRGARNIVAIVDGPAEDTDNALREVLRKAIAAKFAIHAVSLVPNPLIAEMCAETGGNYRESAPENIAHEINILYAALVRRYVVEFDCEATPDGKVPGPVRVQIAIPNCGGEAFWGAVIPEQPALETPASENPKTELPPIPTEVNS